ncbi:IS5 family transposase [Tardiphaga sp. vice352]|uniref:IS5 family transposase n=1 Tax=unclassified Tardiphaga TaxID=2631404 RepID=UPI00116213FE|nr:MULTISPECIES: IS5 family transposase [unclassified Tardiphaga]QDM15534.1 IS5 family transposase [Tardiphaga sp. vice278]QDM25695.1 IS5 family transposase [Tardiphaga sp. vice304]QDM29956.1 IS5 family transposase [Tardiphaga sp. vice352]QDM30896.1 IS5 family transposase [Tardiphaga sp. vice352]QDM30907.1 IS5 family transposase [Tardiphaga sp. vice352]
MWKPEHRLTADRRSLRYPSDLSDAEWMLVAPMIPPARRGGRRRSVNVREVLNAIFYVLSTGCQWSAMPKDLPPKSTAHLYFMVWDWDGTLDRIHDALYVATREAAGREASPTVAIIDSQSSKAAQKGGPALDPQGFDAGKKITGRKRHILVDTLGLLLGVSVHAADIQDRDGAHDLLRRARRRFPFVERIFADGGYQGPKMAKTVAATGSWKIEIVKRSDLHRFVVLPKRWIVERTLAWISRNRRLMRDFERYTKTVAAFVRLAMIRIMLRRLTRSTQCS